RPYRRTRPHDQNRRCTRLKQDRHSQFQSLQCACLKLLRSGIVSVSHSRSEPARPPPQSGHRQDRRSATALQSQTRPQSLPATSPPRLWAQHLLGPLMLTTQTAQHHAIAGASETTGSLVFRPRERPPTQQHQAPSRPQRCAPSRLSTIFGAAQPKSLSRPASSSLDRPQYPLSEPFDNWGELITGAELERKRLNVSIVFEALTPCPLL